MNPLILLWLFGSMADTAYQQPSKGSSMFRVFNAFQMICVFAALPFVISWLSTNPFPYAQAAFWSAIGVYGVMGIGLTAATASAIKNWD